MYTLTTQKRIEENTSFYASSCILRVTAGFIYIVARLTVDCTSSPFLAPYLEKHSNTYVATPSLAELRSVPQLEAFGNKVCA